MVGEGGMKWEPQRPGDILLGVVCTLLFTTILKWESLLPPGLASESFISRNPDLAKVINILVGSCTRLSWTWKVLTCSCSSMRIWFWLFLGCIPELAAAPAGHWCLPGWPWCYTSHLPSWLLVHCQLFHDPWVSICELCGAQQATAYSTLQGTECSSTLWLDSPSHLANPGFQPNLVAHVKIGWNFSLYRLVFHLL